MCESCKYLHMILYHLLLFVDPHTIFLQHLSLPLLQGNKPILP